MTGRPTTDRRTDVERTARRTSGHGFWIVGAVATTFMASSSAPSPLYGLYAQRFHFSPTVLTAVFAIYVVALLLTLLVAGSLSDAIGRKPVILIALGIQSIAMVEFLLATDTGWLFAARTTQGVSTGLVTAAAAAALLDLQDRPDRGALVNSVAPSAGLAAGALLAGVLVEYGPAPTRLVYGLLLAGFVLLAVAMVRVPESVLDRRRPALAVRVRVDPEVRGPFLSVIPAFVATWGLGGFFLSLGPSLAYLLEQSTNRLVGGIAVALLTGAGGISSVITRNWATRRGILLGCTLLVVGDATILVAIGATSPSVLFVGSFVAGLGFGATFLAAFRAVSGLARPTNRGELVSAIYVASYLAFSVPAVIAGICTTQFGLRPTALVYGATVAVLAIIVIPATARTIGRR